MSGLSDISLRCFIAIDIPEPIKRELGDISDLLKKYDVDIKWVPVSTIHLTVKFLGKTPEILLQKIQESLFNVVLSYNPFYIKIYGVGVFPDRRHPRVVWIGTEESAALKQLTVDIESSMASLGFQKEKKDFSPHLTLGRVRSQRGMIQLLHELDNFRDRDFGNMSVDHILLMKSELKSTGAEYSRLCAIPLGGK